jgi:arsenical pump membrane protein
MAAVTVGMLVGGVAGVIIRPFRLPPWCIPSAIALAVIVFGLISVHGARQALDPLVDPIAFLLAAVPLAVMLDQLGFFSTIAERLTSTGRGCGALWALAAVATTVLNLDASVVLLTPLYVNIARRTGHDPLTLAFQPVLLACLASSALPVSNLTNLIAAEHTGARVTDFVANLAVPSLVATVVGWLLYRRALQPDIRQSAIDVPPARVGHPHALGFGAVLLSIILIGFVAGPRYGIEPWAVAAAADIVLVIILRRPPWPHIPCGTALTVGSLAVLAAAAVEHLDISRIIGGTSTAPLATTILATAGAANLLNNLPALLVALPALGDHPTPALWATLIGVNMGPVVLVTGSLASLLWLDALGRLGVKVRPRDFTRVGLRVGLPAATAGSITFLALNAFR